MTIDQAIEYELSELQNDAKMIIQKFIDAFTPKMLAVLKEYYEKLTRIT